jgi:hypothetical protein
MKVISARSPYQIIINEAGQTGSKVELFIWNKGTTEPTIPTYIMSENIASITQTETNYNISPYILEYINQISATLVTTPAVELNTDWCNVRVKRYKNVSGTFTLLNNLLYVGINAYTDISNGYNYDIADGESFALLGYQTYKIQYHNVIPYYNFICERGAGLTYKVSYYSSTSTLISSNTFLTSGTAEIYNFKIPLAFNNSVYMIIDDGTNDIVLLNTEKLEECKYTPVNVNFVNQLGGWQQITFFKAQTNTINVKGSEYNLMQSNVNYNPLIGQKKSFNINGTQTIKLNTGWVYETYNYLIQELLMSETVLLNNNIPVTLKTQSLTYKTNILDKNINFEIEFEYSNSILNNLV